MLLIPHYCYRKEIINVWVIKNPFNDSGTSHKAVFWFWFWLSGSCVLIAYLVRCQLIPLIHIQSTLYRYSIDTFVNTQLALHRHLGQRSVDAYESIGTQQQTVDQPTVDQLSIECWLRIDWDVHWVRIKMSTEGINQEYRSTLNRGCL